jgi:hypothetical protein
VYVDDEPVCWVLIHEDNSMGIMFTREEYRRKGLAEVVTRDLTRRIIENGQIPYLQIVDGNMKSHGLANKCGFEQAGRCEWFGIIAGEPKEIKDIANAMLSSFEKTYGRSRYQKEQGQVEIKYFVMPWKDAFDEDYTARSLEKDETCTEWTEIMEKACGVNQVKDRMEAWVIEKESEIIGAALMERAEDREDYWMHAFKLISDASLKDALHALANEIEKAEGYFICTTVMEEASSAYEHAKFESCGYLNMGK